MNTKLLFQQERGETAFSLALLLAVIAIGTLSTLSAVAAQTESSIETLAGAMTQTTMVRGSVPDITDTHPMIDGIEVQNSPNKPKWPSLARKAQ